MRRTGGYPSGLGPSLAAGPRWQAPCPASASSRPRRRALRRSLRPRPSSRYPAGPKGGMPPAHVAAGGPTLGPSSRATRSHHLPRPPSDGANWHSTRPGAWPPQGPTGPGSTACCRSTGAHKHDAIPMSCCCVRSCARRWMRMALALAGKRARPMASPRAGPGSSFHSGCSSSSNRAPFLQPLGVSNTSCPGAVVPLRSRSPISSHGGTWART